MVFIKVFVNDFQIEVTPHKYEYFDLTIYNVEQVVADNVWNNIQSDGVKKVVVDNVWNNIQSDGVQKYARKRKKAPTVEDVEECVNNNLNYIEVTLNKKCNEIVTRKKT